MAVIQELADLAGRGWRKAALFIRVRLLNWVVIQKARQEHSRPVVFFNASARLEGLNLNAAFQLLASLGVRLAGKPVVHFGCLSGMKQCVLGAVVGDPQAPPPCQGCIRHTRLFSGGAETVWFEYQENPELAESLESLPVGSLENYSFQDIPLGKLILPSLRWALRRHQLQEDPQTRNLIRAYLLSAYQIWREFSRLIKSHQPDVVVVFNGLQFPEAVVRWTARQAGIRVITHEVNLQPFSAFFTTGQATIYPMDIPETFQLSQAQHQRLDAYLSKRFRGDFRMAGVQFWSSMDHLPEELVQESSSFQGLVPVFTNVIFDTSQAHANLIFQDMFEWLDQVLDAASRHPQVLFVIRAHPDEMRQGKSSQESVMGWAESRRAADLKNIRLIPPDQTWSSYELIQRSKFCLVYNSSIGLEAALMGKPVLCAGKARYTQIPIVYFPATREAYQQKLEEMLVAPELAVPDEFSRNARRFLYYQLYRASLPFGRFLSEHPTPGYVQLRAFPWQTLAPGGSRVMDTVVRGIIDDEPFILEEKADEALLPG